MNVSDHRHGPSAAGSVVLNLGADIGALILETPAALLGTEIEISPAGGGPRTHAMVRERLTAPAPRYDAVYPDLRAGEYVIWRNATTVEATIEIGGARITEYVWLTESSDT